MKMCGPVTGSLQCSRTEDVENSDMMWHVSPQWDTGWITRRRNVGDSGNHPQMALLKNYLQVGELLYWLVVWNMTLNFPYIGNVIIPTDFHSIIFQRGRSTTNQLMALMDSKLVIWVEHVILFYFFHGNTIGIPPTSYFSARWLFHLGIKCNSHFWMSLMGHFTHEIPRGFHIIAGIYVSSPLIYIYIYII